mgnify:CR=1 FL=1
MNRDDLYQINTGYMPDCGQYGLWIYDSPSIGGTRCLLTEHGPEPHEPGQFHSPSARFTKPQMEQLMTRLWAEGIRPSDWGSEGETAALKDHLADMRKLAMPDGGR